MKKFIQYLTVFILIIFILPAMLTRQNKLAVSVETPIEEQNQIQEQTIIRK